MVQWSLYRLMYTTNSGCNDNLQPSVANHVHALVILHCHNHGSADDDIRICNGSSSTETIKTIIMDIITNIMPDQ